jgi:hypothetical protein
VTDITAGRWPPFSGVQIKYIDWRTASHKAGSLSQGSRHRAGTVIEFDIARQMHQSTLEQIGRYLDHLGFSINEEASRLQAFQKRRFRDTESDPGEDLHRFIVNQICNGV